jgi:hypothetical protein
MSDRSMDGKAAYESPVLTRIGAFEEVTQATQPVQQHTDFPFPSGTPDSKLTFS